MKTFAELGIPFPLFAAPVDPADDSDYVGYGLCCICGCRKVACFRLGVGSAFIVDCPKCRTANAIRVGSNAEVACRVCTYAVKSHQNHSYSNDPKTCYECLRAGMAAIAKDTEFGMVSWDEAFIGVTNGVPDLKQDQFESVVVNVEDNWIGVKLPKEIMFELLRTPTYGTWQGECWLFCCQNPMTFLGEWNQKRFNERAADGDGKALYYSIVEPTLKDTWDYLGQGLCVYVFECKGCGKLRLHSDCD